jgi:hypothetical protein
MPSQGNAVASAWPTADEFRRALRQSCKLVESLEDVANSLYENVYSNGNAEEVTLEQLGALTAFVSVMEADADAMRDLVRNLARVRDAACPQL